MSWSLGEIRSLATKAARGAGFHWGLAEEAGGAVAWLERNGAPGATALAKYLQSVVNDEIGGDCCPIATGAAYGDGWRPENREFGTIKQPLLLAAFVGQTSEPTITGLMIGDIKVLANAAGISVEGEPARMLIASARCQLMSGVNEPGGGWLATPRLRIGEASRPAVTILSRFASRIYAPATEQSRMTGAGAGIQDND